MSWAVLPRNDLSALPNATMFAAVHRARPSVFSTVATCNGCHPTSRDYNHRNMNSRRHNDGLFYATRGVFCASRDFLEISYFNGLEWLRFRQKEKDKALTEKSRT